MTNESKPDLTPAEARAEVEAFMGEGWTVDAHAPNDPCLAGVRAWWHSDALVGLHSDATTLRAAVDALFQAWRDAVRPWCVRTLDVAEDAIVSWESGGGDCWAYQTEQGDPLEASDIVARVLKESDHD